MKDQLVFPIVALMRALNAYIREEIGEVPTRLQLDLEVGVPEQHADMLTKLHDEISAAMDEAKAIAEREDRAATLAESVVSGSA
jgi:hypothetical protein